MLHIWGIAALVACCYCLYRATEDLRQRRYVLGAVGIISALVFLLTPIQTHAVKIDLPSASDH